MSASPPLLALRGATLGYGAAPLLNGVDLALARGDRACLVGRNGSGKSTLLGMLAGLVEPDTGERFVQPGAQIALLAQEPPFDPGETVGAYVARQRRGNAHAHRVDAWLDRLRLDPDRRLGTMSGGELRRAALAQALAAETDILLLDEPTNHLDLPTIEWLEDEIRRFRGAMLVVSHDRAFLAGVTNRVHWLHHGQLRTSDRGFADFDAWVEQVLIEEEREAKRLDSRLRLETEWLRRGVSARRRRNQGRLARLAGLRETRAALLGRPTRAALVLSEGEVRSRLIIEAKGIGKSFGGRAILRGFSTRILRGDRVGLIGPNGAGKTTLLRLLIGDLAPDDGRVRIADGVVRAYFDQQRAQLDGSASLWETLCPQGGDTVMVQGRPRHVVGYLKDFLFEPERARSPVSSLSGGERNRLLLAKTLAQPSDLLVMDEPTNDLDLETLDLLEDTLADFAGTLLVVSHDRDFLDRIATSVVALEGDGRAEEFPGGYSDYRRQRREVVVTPAPAARAAAAPERPRTAAARLSFKEQRELDRLTERIAELEADIAEVEAALGDPGLYLRDPSAFERQTTRLASAQQELADAEERWLLLEEKREAVTTVGR